MRFLYATKDCVSSSHYFGETYESNCDCTNIENSFGLNVGTYDFVKEYLGNDKGFIIKCKVYYKDIGRIVKNGNNIRCFRITVLE